MPSYEGLERCERCERWTPDRTSGRRREWWMCACDEPPGVHLTPRPPARSCRSCQAPVFFVTTRRGKKMPLNHEPDPKGNVILSGNYEVADVLAGAALETARALRTTSELFMPHHATCPQREQWR